MRKASQYLYFAAASVALLLGSTVMGNAQPREKFVISAKAGGINAVSGRAVVHGRGTSEWQQLTIKEDLNAGDVVKTGSDGRVEMLLNPGAYLRVGENSEFELTDNSLDSLEVKLVRGTAIVEVAGAEDTELLINISTPDTRMAIVRRGLYRVNVRPGDGTELIVRKGRVMLEDSQTKVKGGNKVTFTRGGSVWVAKLQKQEKKDFDTLDAWSKERAETVAKANRRIRGRDVNLLMASYNNNWFNNGFGRPNGLWYFNPTVGCYTFLPFHMGWGSPYGSSYRMSVYGGYGCCGRSVYGVTNGGGGRGYGNSGGGGGNNGGGRNGGNVIPPSAPPSTPSMPTSMPSAAERKVERLNDRMPNQPNQ